MKIANETLNFSNYKSNVKQIIEYRFADHQYDYILELYTGESLKISTPVKEFIELIQ